MTSPPGYQMLPYDCHEGNSALRQGLGGERAEDRKLEEDAKKGIIRPRRPIQGELGVGGQAIGATPGARGARARCRRRRRSTAAGTLISATQALRLTVRSVRPSDRTATHGPAKVRTIYSGLGSTAVSGRPATARRRTSTTSGRRRASC